VVEALHVLVLEDSVEVIEGDKAVFGVPTHVQNFAAFLEEGRRKQAQRKMCFDDPVKVGIEFTLANIFPARNVPAKNVPAKNIPAKSVPTKNVPTKNVPAKSIIT